MNLLCFKQCWAVLGEKSKFCIFCIKSHILIWNTKITNGEVLSDSMKLTTVLGRFGLKIKILHILHKIAYFDLEHRNNQ